MCEDNFNTRKDTTKEKKTRNNNKNSAERKESEARELIIQFGFAYVCRPRSDMNEYNQTYMC